MSRLHVAAVLLALGAGATGVGLLVAAGARPANGPPTSLGGSVDSAGLVLSAGLGGDAKIVVRRVDAAARSLLLLTSGDGASGFNALGPFAPSMLSPARHHVVAHDGLALGSPRGGEARFLGDTLSVAAHDQPALVRHGAEVALAPASVALSGRERYRWFLAVSALTPLSLATSDAEPGRLTCRTYAPIPALSVATGEQVLRVDGDGLTLEAPRGTVARWPSPPPER
ncbi:MAG: hypothetical protein EP329_28750 [Deltaproteobacteria bacterium]|nr:MAG: hypothetical protein EP329_28750 [Deltaproteobacteria bacterium]